jgi:hypothetical protein
MPRRTFGDLKIPDKIVDIKAVNMRRNKRPAVVT